MFDHAVVWPNCIVNYTQTHASSIYFGNGALVAYFDHSFVDQMFPILQNASFFLTFVWRYFDIITDSLYIVNCIYTPSEHTVSITVSSEGVYIQFTV